MGMNRRFVMVVSIFLISAAVSGCATLPDFWKRLLGTSTSALEEGRKDAVTRTFDYDYPATFEKTQEVIKAIGKTSIYCSDIKGHKIAFYYVDINTNTAGVFFTRIDSGRTQVEVVSAGKDVKQFLAEKIFSGLESKEQ